MCIKHVTSPFYVALQLYNYIIGTDSIFGIDTMTGIDSITGMDTIVVLIPVPALLTPGIALVSIPKKLVSTHL